MAEDLTALSLSLVRDAGGRWVQTCGRRSHPILTGGRAARALARPVAGIADTECSEFKAGQLDLALAASRWPEDRTGALLLFDFLTEPQVIHRASVVNANVRFDIRLRGQKYWLNEAWRDVFVPHLAEAAADVLVIVDRHLRRAHQLLTVAGTAKPGWEPQL